MKTASSTGPKRYAIVALAIVGLLLLTWGRTSCNNVDALSNLLNGMRVVMDKHEIQYVLQAGTLLGVIRDGHVIPSEFDNDIEIARKDYDKVMSLRNEFEAEGIRLYGTTDGNFVKALWDAYFIKWEPTLENTPVCMRFTTPSSYFYTDVYCSEIVPSADVPAFGEKHHLTNLPATLLPEDYYCTPDEGGGGTGCYPTSMYLPIKKHSTASGDYWVPAKPEEILEIYYGPTWRTPVSKGIKKGWCSDYFYGIVIIFAAVVIFLYMRD